MTKEVMIHIEACHQTDETSTEREYIRAEVCGEYKKEGDFHLLTYEQVLEEGHPPVLHSLQFQEHHMIMTKRLEEDAVMEFKLGENIPTLYPTPYGCLDMKVNTQQLEITMEETRIKLAVTYALTMEDALLSKCQLTLAIEERDESGT
ncbi:MAG: DUF1934 domain-containing protein [Eubacteriales bacterium]